MSQDFTMIEKYKSVIEKERKTGYVKLAVIEPTDKNYELGWMYRYFTRQSNSTRAPIYEIDKKQFDSHANPNSGLDKGFYKVCRVKWLISGPTTMFEDSYGNSRKGVLQANNDSATLADKKFPNIHKFLENNLLKYYK